MRLHQFIREHQDAILADWDAFATTAAPAAAHMSRAAIRDHAQEMLEAIANDLSVSQTDQQQLLKSHGKAPVLTNAPQTAAQTHALTRARSGFDINEMVAEYRALRASVLRLWAANEAPESIDVQDTIRFNEAIDQSLTESVCYFTKELERSRNLLLGILCHDMRNPLHVVLLTAKHLAHLNAGTVVSTAAGRLISSGGRLQALVDDMVDFNRSNLGVGIRILQAPCDLQKVFEEEVELQRTANPGRDVRLTCKGDLQGSWDCNRLHQVLGNLVTNAVKYGDATRPVEVDIVGRESDVTFTVSNAGPPIPAEFMAHMFEPLKRGLNPEPTANHDGSMGLGLYIAKELVKAHGGQIDATSDAERTTFTVVLPRVTGS